MLKYWKRFEKVALHIGDSLILQASLSFGILLLAFISPVEGISASACLWQKYFHISCPGCGLTRSFIEFAHGDYQRSFELNMAGPLFFIFFLFIFIDRVLQLVSRKHFVGFVFLEKIKVLNIVLLLLVFQWAAKAL